MASIWFTFSIIFGVISQIITIPLRKVPEEPGYTGLNEQAQREQTGRIRRAAYSVPPGCKKGVKFVFINVTDCPVTNAKYDVDRNQCLEKILHVPGMPDGPKGYIYIALNHYLYKTYQATTRRGLQKCPPAVVAPTTSPPSKTMNPTTASQKVTNEIPTQAGIQNTSGNVTTKVAKVILKPTTKANITLST